MRAYSLESGDEAHEVAGLQRGVADEAAVDVGLGEQFGCVAGLAAAAVQDSGVICISAVIDISPSNLDSSLCFLQSSMSDDVLCIEVK